MTLEELLTLPLPKRIEWLRSTDGPRGKLSHDKLATKIGTTRQTVIGWEQGREPNLLYAEKLAEFSGFPATAFRRSEERWPDLSSATAGRTRSPRVRRMGSVTI